MKLKYNGTPDMKTEQIRSTLYFLQFIENKIINRQVPKEINQDIEAADGFSKFMSIYLK